MQKRCIIIMILSTVFLCSCKENSAPNKTNTENNTQNEIATSTDGNLENDNELDIVYNTEDHAWYYVATGSDSSKEDTYPMSKTKEYFENVNKDYTYDDIASEIGPADGWAGSGIHYDIWILEDGSKASITFWSTTEPNDSVIDRIGITYPDGSYELIYKREY